MKNRKIRLLYLYEFKLGSSAAEAHRNITRAFSQVTVTIRTVQLWSRFEVASSLLLRNKKEPFLDRILTCDEKWILYDNTRRCGQWLDYDEHPKHCPKPDLHPKKGNGHGLVDSNGSYSLQLS